MMEGRALIPSLEKAKAGVEKLGGQFKGDYISKDIIFIPKKVYNLSKDFVRVRVYTKNNWPTKNVILVRKKTEWKDQSKIDNIAIKIEFDSEKEAFAYIKDNLPEFEKGFEYSRHGWQYNLGMHRIFIEDIEKFLPSVEAEAENEVELQTLFRKLGVKKIVNESVPEIMQRIQIGRASCRERVYVTV